MQRDGGAYLMVYGGNGGVAVTEEMLKTQNQNGFTNTNFYHLFWTIYHAVVYV